MSARYQSPGVYVEDRFPPPPAELRTGVPAFVGLIGQAAISQQKLDLRQLKPGLWLVRPSSGASSPSSRPDRPLQRWREFGGSYGAIVAQSYLAHAVHGFFTNGGALCYVAPIVFDQRASAQDALIAGLELLAPLDDIDLICAPDIVLRARDTAEAQAMQRAVLDHCAAAGDRFAILDAPREAGSSDLRAALDDANGALYYPWIGVVESGGAPLVYVPPCGHVAGIYARSDAATGVHKAPANEPVEGALSLASVVTAGEQQALSEARANCLRSFPGRGIRVWGARTLSSEPAWRYVNVRRLFLTAGRWIARSLASVSFEPNDPRLWAQIGRELTAYCEDLFRGGALKGASSQEAYFIKCDLDTNPPEVRERGEVVTEIGLAPSLPNEFIIVRIVHQAGGVTFAGPA